MKVSELIVTLVDLVTDDTEVMNKVIIFDSMGVEFFPDKVRVDNDVLIMEEDDDSL